MIMCCCRSDEWGFLNGKDQQLLTVVRLVTADNVEAVVYGAKVHNLLLAIGCRESH
jgi:hypothetical protein